MARSRHRPRRRAAPAPARRSTVSITAIGGQGDGAGDADGARVFIPLTAPGDVALADISGEHGRLVELLEASSLRKEPPCPHYGACGGCALQHVSDDFYRRWKREQVVEALARAGLGAAPVANIIATPAASRRRATFAVRKSRTGLTLGFNERQSAHVVNIDDCRVLHPNLLAGLPALRMLAAKIPAQRFDLAVTLCRNGLDIDVIGGGASPLVGAALRDLAGEMRAARCIRLSLNGEPLLTLSPPIVEFDGVAVTPSPGGFLQASAEGEAALLGLVTAAALGARKVADLFSGCGAFALPLAKNASVYAADSDDAAISSLLAAVSNAQRAGAAINPVRGEARNLFERPLTPNELNAFDAVVFDPPRAGAREQAEALARSRVKTVIGVSCNAATFARDAAILSQGGYQLAKVTPVDQFVYSPHIEVVGVFTR